MKEIIDKALHQEKLYLQSINLFGRFNIYIITYDHHDYLLKTKIYLLYQITTGQRQHSDVTVPSPVNHLKHACEHYATAVKLEPKNSEWHFKLAQILEEMHYAEHYYGVKLEV